MKTYYVLSNSLFFFAVVVVAIMITLLRRNVASRAYNIIVVGIWCYTTGYLFLYSRTLIRAIDPALFRELRAILKPAIATANGLRTIGIIVIAVGLVRLYLFYRDRQMTAASEPAHENNAPAGFSGWLILPAIGLVLGSIINAIMFGVSLRLYSKAARAGFGDVYTMEIVALFAMTVFLVYVAILFFRKKRKAPVMMITYLITNVVLALILLTIEAASGADHMAIETAKQLFRAFVGALIWVPYFLVSKRVKATFVRE